MTQEEKDLLLKDLCARLPYGVKVNIKRDFPNNPQIVERIGCDGEIIVQNIFAYDIYYYKPYLRPMSSMTEREKEEFQYIAWGKIFETTIVRLDFGISYKTVAYIEDWLNAHHFDYRGLIEKGLALEASEDMYKTK